MEFLINSDIHHPKGVNSDFCSNLESLCEINGEEDAFEDEIRSPNKSEEISEKEWISSEREEVCLEFVDCTEFVNGSKFVNGSECDFDEEEIMFPEIDNQYITPTHIQKAASYVTQIACVNLSYSTYKSTLNHCCSLCEKSHLKAISDFFINNNMDDLKSTNCGCSIDVTSTSSEILNIINTQKTFENSIVTILQTLVQNIRLRLTELIIGVVFYERLLKMHWQCSVFVIFRQSLKTLFLACLLVAHKMSADSVYNNNFLSKMFSVSLSTLKEFESGVLSLLDFDLNISPEQYEQMRRIFS